MQILGLIPARGGSKGIPGKNGKLLAGKPLIAYTIEAALACQGLTEVVVSTDDDTLAVISAAHGATVPFRRPAHLATDHSPTIDTVVHALQYYQEQSKYFDAVCLLQPTTPFRTTAAIDRAITQFTSSKADALVSVREVPHQFNPHWVFMPQGEAGTLQIATGDSTIISRRQELPPAYYRDGAIYLTRSEIVLEQHSLYGQSLTYIVSDSAQFVNLDTMADWHAAEQMIQQG